MVLIAPVATRAAEDEGRRAEAVSAADPFEARAKEEDPFDIATPLRAAAYLASPNPSSAASKASFQETLGNASGDNANKAADVTPEPLPDPCRVADEKPLGELGINIVLPSGLLPKDYAGACWAQINATSGPAAALRFWPTTQYSWDAACLCYRPLYFEETNLERHGYGCCCKCLQPAISAAHFFGTVPALPYCMAAHCPCECEYTLGHYRPGSCPPWRYNWPSCDPLAAAAEGGVLTGMIFLIP